MKVHDLRPGDKFRTLGAKRDSYWRFGTVVAVLTGSVYVKYDSGSKEHVSAEMSVERIEN